jgi:hypothetical protein
MMTYKYSKHHFILALPNFSLQYSIHPDLPRQTGTEAAERHCLPRTVFKHRELAEFRNFDALPTNLILIKK